MRGRIPAVLLALLATQLGSLISPAYRAVYRDEPLTAAGTPVRLLTAGGALAAVTAAGLAAGLRIRPAGGPRRAEA
ncbi:hypothetical protein ACFXPW_24330 [Streptomyces goshikiensis]|uniref:hypothetical protein n=1 Tax=Streptomyces goshikiensis TaxID=1942 RepID=UPI0036C73C50